MSEPILEDNLNKILLKPRFKEELLEDKSAILKKFEDYFKQDNSKFRTKTADSHIVIDVPDEEDQFWSPQLQIEIITEDDKTILTG